MPGIAAEGTAIPAQRAHLAGHDDAAALGDVVAPGAQAVAVQRGSQVAAVGERHADSSRVFFLVEVGHADAHVERHAERLGAFDEQLVENAARNAVVTWQAIALGHADARDRVACGRADVHGRVRKAALHGLVHDAQLPQRAQRVPRLDDADAVDVKLGLQLGDLDLVLAVLAQCDRRGEAAETAAHNQDLHGSSSCCC